MICVPMTCVPLICVSAPGLSVRRDACLLTSADDSRERGTGGGGGSGGSSAASGSKGVDLAEQVMQAQTDWSIRPNQGMHMATGKGKSGAKEAAQRDYKAILSTADANDPTMEREAAKVHVRLPDVSAQCLRLEASNVS